jgi:DNA-binding transcriptional LysR family regulator
LKVCAEGQLVFNNVLRILDVAVAGFEIAYVPEGSAQSYLAKERLERILEDWCPP